MRSSLEAPLRTSRAPAPPTSHRTAASSRAAAGFERAARRGVVVQHASARGARAAHGRPAQARPRARVNARRRRAMHTSFCATRVGAAAGAWSRPRVSARARAARQRVRGARAGTEAVRSVPGTVPGGRDCLGQGHPFRPWTLWTGRLMLRGDPMVRSRARGDNNRRANGAVRGVHAWLARPPLPPSAASSVLPHSPIPQPRSPPRPCSNSLRAPGASHHPALRPRLCPPVAPWSHVLFLSSHLAQQRLQLALLVDGCDQLIHVLTLRLGVDDVHHVVRDVKVHIAGGHPHAIQRGCASAPLLDG